jgi:hypothetical protein
MCRTDAAQRQFRLTEASPTGRPSQSSIESKSQSLAYWRLESKGSVFDSRTTSFRYHKSWEIQYKFEASLSRLFLIPVIRPCRG